ncbi:ureidoglycolate lyase [Homoserinimonas sp. A447]
MTATTTVHASLVTANDFAPFGRVLVMDAREDTDDIIVTRGDGWVDHRTRLPLIASTGSLGMTIGEPAPFVVRAMERHENTEEALFPTSEAIVLAVAPPDQASAPDSSKVRAFILPPGRAVVLSAGTWHDACHGVSGAVPYYWFASCIDSGTTPWTEVAGGPVTVTLGAVQEPDGV